MLRKEKMEGLYTMYIIWSIDGEESIQKALTFFLSKGKAREPKIPKREATAVSRPSTVSDTPESYTKAVCGCVCVCVYGYYFSPISRASLYPLLGHNTSFLPSLAAVIPLVRPRSPLLSLCFPFPLFSLFVFHFHLWDSGTYLWGTGSIALGLQYFDWSICSICRLNFVVVL